MPRCLVPAAERDRGGSRRPRDHGEGQWVETSLFQGVLAFTTQLWQDMEHESPEVFSLNRDPQPGIFECADGLWVHSMHGAGGRGKDRSALWRILGIEPQEPTRERRSSTPAGPSSVPPSSGCPDRTVGEASGPTTSPSPRSDPPPRRSTTLCSVADGWTVEIDDPVHGRTRQVGPTFHLRGTAPAAPPDPGRASAAHGRGPHGHRGRSPGSPGRLRGKPLAHALDGVSVLDLGNFLAGPFGPMLLGELGATVYKLESPEGDQMRPITKPFNGCQRGKLDVVADLKTPRASEIAHRLIGRSTWSTTTCARVWPSGWASTTPPPRRSTPTLSIATPACGASTAPGPRGRGSTSSGQSSCGLEHELGGDGNPPVWYRFGMCDQACACQSAVAVLLALYWRARTGQGQFVDTSIVSGGLFYSSDQWIGPDGPVRPTAGRLGADRVRTALPALRTSGRVDRPGLLGGRHWRSLRRAVP